MDLLRSAAKEGIGVVRIRPSQGQRKGQHNHMCGMRQAGRDSDVFVEEAGVALRG